MWALKMNGQLDCGGPAVETVYAAIMTACGGPIAAHSMCPRFQWKPAAPGCPGRELVAAVRAA
jgi:hypothetical protein